MEEPKNEQGVPAAAQAVGEADTPRIDNAQTGYSVELSDDRSGDAEMLNHLLDDAINASQDREDLIEWAKHDKSLR